MLPIDSIIGKTTFITGTEKNAGKTALLVLLLRLLRTRTPLFYTSAGLDGEGVCTVTGDEKPGIHCEPGDLIATSGCALKESGARFELIEVFPWVSALGRTVFARAASGGKVELVGPETNFQLGEIIRVARMFAQGATILVDGAAGRLTQVSSVLRSGFVHVVKLEPANFGKTIQRLRLLELLNSLGPFAGDEKEAFIVSGALTAGTGLPDDVDTIIIEDQSRVFLPPTEFERLLSKYRVFVREILPMRFCTARIVDFDREKALAELRKAAPSLTIIGNPYEDVA